MEKSVKTKSIRIPKEMAEAIAVVEKEEQIEESTAMRKLIRMGFETYVGNLYRDGRITLRRASQLLRRSHSEVIDLFMDAGIKGNLEASDVLASLDRFVRK
jgi:predicted HTH domain antitoxin